MRCDQMMGLPPYATTYLAENEVPPVICPCCNRPYPRRVEEIGVFVGMFEDEYPLYRYRLKVGMHADEFLQASPPSSGPCFFIGLNIVHEDGTLVTTFKWCQSDIDKA